MSGVTVEQSDLVSILDKIASNRIFEGLKHENLLTREEWGDVLGICRRSVGRWEQEIISNVRPISNDYFTVKRMRAPYLDPYQRFILALIYIVKGGLDNRNKPHQTAIDFLKVNFMNLKREQFEQWRKNNV